MKVAVVGCGNVSKNHFCALKEIKNAEIVATVDIKKERADIKAAENNAKAYYDFDEMLQNEHPDCVHIATPHYLHTPMAIKALKSGANVFLEKPCSVTNEEADALINAQKQSNKQLGVCLQNRYNDSSVTAKSIIDKGTLGELKAIRAFVTWSRDKNYYSDDWHGTLAKECGGVLINQAIHTIDLIQYFGSGCKNVTAHVFNDHLKNIIEVEDTATVRFELNNGVTALLYATTAFSVNSDVFIELTFEKGILRLEGEHLYKITESGFEELCKKSEKEFVGKNYWGHGHKAIIKDFYDCLETGRHFDIDAEEGSKSAKIVTACYNSSKENKTIEVK